MESQNYIETQQLLYTVSVYSEDTVLTDHRSNDVQYLVDGQELMKMFQTRIVFKPEPGLHWMVQDGQTQTCLLEIPEQSKAFDIGFRDSKDNEHLLKLKLPSMAFRFEVVLGGNMQTSISNIHGWCYRGKLKGETPLYEIPLPNFSGSGFCAGTADRSVTTSFRDTLLKTLFDSWFNTHHNQCGRNNLPLPDFIEKSQGKVSLRDCNRIGTGHEILSPNRY